MALFEASWAILADAEAGGEVMTAVVYGGCTQGGMGGSPYSSICIGWARPVLMRPGPRQGQYNEGQN